MTSPMTPSEDITTDSVPDPPRVITNAPTDTIVSNEAKEEPQEKSSENVAKAKQQQKKEDEHLKPSSSNGSSRSRSKSPCSDTPKTHKHGARKKKSSGSTEYHIQNSSNIQIGPSYTVVMGGGGGSAQTMMNSESKQAKDFYKKMKRSDECITTSHIRKISPHVGENWRDLGRILQFTDGQLGRIKLENFPEGMKEVVYQMLLEWMRSKGRDATVGVLIKALWESKEYSAIIILGSPVEDDEHL